MEYTILSVLLLLYDDDYNVDTDDVEMIVMILVIMIVVMMTMLMMMTLCSIHHQLIMYHRSMAKLDIH